MTTPMIEAVNVHKAFGQLEVLKGIDLTVQPGEVAVLLGPSGSGKSTFLRCLNLLEKPSGGQILYHDVDLVSADAKTSTKVLLGMGMVFQQFNLFPHMSVLDNIMLAPTMVKGQDKQTSQEQAQDRGPGGQEGCLPRPALRRPTAAHRHCPGSGHEAGGHALRRAHLRS